MQENNLNQNLIIKSCAVLDTNVLVSSLIQLDRMENFNLNKLDPPIQIFNLIYSGNVVPVFDMRMLSEYVDVLHREKLHLSNTTINQGLSLVINKGLKVNNVKKTCIEFIDRDDIPFFEVKESSAIDSMLVTGNIKHYPAEDDGSIVTPKTFLYILKKLNDFVLHDYAYLGDFEELVAKEVNKGNFEYGEELLLNNPNFIEELCVHNQEKNIKHHVHR